MRDLLELLLEKAKAAHYNWIVNNPEMAQVKAMAELGDAIQEVEGRKPNPHTYECGPSCFWRDKNANGDKSKFYLVAMVEEETKRLSFGLKIRTLTTDPSPYMYDKVLRKGENYCLIEYNIAMRYEVWLNVVEGIKTIFQSKQMKDFDKYLGEKYNPKTK